VKMETLGQVFWGRNLGNGETRRDQTMRQRLQASHFAMSWQTFLQIPALSVLLDALSLFGPKPATPGHVRGRKRCRDAQPRETGIFPKWSSTAPLSCNLYKTKLNRQPQPANSLSARLSQAQKQSLSLKGKVCIDCSLQSTSLKASMAVSDYTLNHPELGSIIGFARGDDVVQFRGIPFASVPGRFRQSILRAGPLPSQPFDARQSG